MVASVRAGTSIGPTPADQAWLSIHTIPTSVRGSFRHSEFQKPLPRFDSVISCLYPSKLFRVDGRLCPNVRQRLAT